VGASGISPKVASFIIPDVEGRPLGEAFKFPDVEDRLVGEGKRFPEVEARALMDDLRALGV
jgi:hypothetical protein